MADNLLFYGDNLKVLERWVRAEILRYAPGWPVGRVDDRGGTLLRAR